MKVFGFLLRIFSYLFNIVICLFLLGIGIVSIASHTTPKLGMLPFTDENMLTGLFVLAIVGLVSTILAWTGIFKYLFPVWTAIVLYLMVKGLLLSPYTFPNASAFQGGLWVIFGAIGAFFGGLWVLKPKTRRI